ncbi:MAG: hypothetical protein GVY16_07840 [Planctomycetes bacterium]|jgi:hypothetical protein|nr:hypothetical protein [Phycisphaerae bacterium]NBB95638.1 hypothetical protein [Planctomycetota bacterium]
MRPEYDIDALARRARQDAPPDVDVAEAVIGELAGWRPRPQRIIGEFAMAASLLAVFVVAAALWIQIHRRNVQSARRDLFGSMPTLATTTQP